MVSIVALQPFVHGAGRFRAGDVLTVSESTARDLCRAGLCATAGTQIIEKKATPVGPVQPLSALPAGQALTPATLPQSVIGDAAEPEKRKRGRPRKVAA